MKRIFFTLTLLLIVMTASAQDTLLVSSSSFKKWSKDLSNSGYPLTQSSNDGKHEFWAKFMLNMESAFVVKITPLTSFEKLISNLDQPERFIYNGLNAAYGLSSSKSYLIIEVPENKVVVSIFTEHTLKKGQMEDIASSVPYKKIK